MVQYASTTPIGRFALLAAAALSLGVARLATHHDERVSYRLELSAPVEPDSIYLTRWYFGDVKVSFEDGDLAPLQFVQRAHFPDGCYYQGTEVLLPFSAHAFTYDYTEQLISCAPGKTPQMYATPRRGIVSAIEIR